MKTPIPSKKPKMQSVPKVVKTPLASGSRSDSESALTPIANALLPARSPAVQVIPEGFNIGGEQVPALEFRAGVYITDAATATGKSTVAAALFLANGSRAFYRYVFEARALPSKITRSRASMGSINEKFTEDTRLYIDPEVFLLDLEHDIVVSKMSEGLLVIDSASLAMRVHNVDLRKSSGTMAQGMSVADLEFITRLNFLALEHSVAIMAIFNSDIVPFVASLEAVAEGKISVLSPTSFMVQDRTSRKARTFVLPNSLSAAAREQLLGYKQSEDMLSANDPLSFASFGGTSV